MKLFAIFALAAVAAISLFAPGLQSSSEAGHITVTGDAEVRVAPDEVILTLGVETSDLELDSAKAENDEIIQRVLELAQAYDIEAKHIQTDHISIEPRYRDNYEQRTFLGYFVRKTVVLTLKDLDKFEDLLTDMLKAEANYVHGVEFRTTELRQHRDEARALAIRAAQEKAEALAGELGQTVGRPVLIREEQNFWRSGYSAWWGSRGGGGLAQNVVQNVGQEPAAVDGSLAPGQIAVNARVTVEFALE